jgi:hypothetical protein
MTKFHQIENNRPVSDFLTALNVKIAASEFQMEKSLENGMTSK